MFQQQNRHQQANQVRQPVEQPMPGASARRQRHSAPHSVPHENQARPHYRDRRDGRPMMGNDPRRVRQQRPQGPSLIDLDNVGKTYQSESGIFHALKQINLQIWPGEFVAVVGKSGSGKSTLINLITGIDRPTSGGIQVGETVVNTLTENQMARWRGRHIGLVFQFFQLLPTLSVIENVMLPMDFNDTYPLPVRRSRAMNLLSQVGMTEQARKLPSALSGGQQQRVAIARSLANDPPLIVADEPTGNLDSKTAESVFRLFRTLVREGKTILMVTHDAELAHSVDRTVTIADGHIVSDVRN
ncbi:MAG: ABC transporter ATP-binding protein [Chloroflexota bacterium]